jgi:hypothetical protein
VVTSRQPLVAELAESRSSSADSVGTQLHAALYGDRNDAPLQAASLILLDRSEDLCSPCSAGHARDIGVPLAHRIINTLNYCQYNQSNTAYERAGLSATADAAECPVALSLDVALQAPVLEQYDWDTAAALIGVSSLVPGGVPSALTQWNKPMSALTNLPLQLNPSLHLDGKSSSPLLSEVHRCVLLGTEEEGKTALCDALKAAILAEKGVLPPAKKRGLGAEVLAYAQALVQCPATDRDEGVASDDATLSAAAAYRCGVQGGLGYNYAVCLRHQGLLSLSLGVIEAMQRSSGKQLQQLCAWQCAYDVRAAREAELDAVARNFQDLAVCIAHLMSYFLPGSKSVSTPVLGKSSGAGKEKEAPATAGPLDMTHILVQLIR